MAESIGLLVGAKKIARHVFGDENEFKKIYQLKQQLGLFRMNGQICGRPQTILEHIKACEAASSES
jgi:hypothetical protein